MMDNLENWRECYEGMEGCQRNLDLMIINSVRCKTCNKFCRLVLPNKIKMCQHIYDNMIETYKNSSPTDFLTDFILKCEIEIYET